MDYTARIQELNMLKSLITSKVISTDQVDGFSSEVSGWEGSAPSGFSSLVDDTKSRVQEVYETKEIILEAIDARITELQTLIDDQYAANSGIPYMHLDDDPQKNRSKQRARVYRIANLDSSVRNRLLSRI